MRGSWLFTLALASLAGCSKQRDARVDGGDSSFVRLQQRGETAMGVNQYTSQHVFEPLPDGGRIALQRKESDSVGEETIRAHMRTIAKSFSNGDFALPGFVHATSDVTGHGDDEKIERPDQLCPEGFAARGRGCHLDEKSRRSRSHS